MILILITWSFFQFSLGDTFLCDFYASSYPNLYKFVRCPRNDAEICDCYNISFVTFMRPDNRGFFYPRTDVNTTQYALSYALDACLFTFVG